MLQRPYSLILAGLNSYMPMTQAFSKGLCIYLKRHAYKNASTEDLWKALEESSGQPVGTIMRHWTQQMGYPIVTVRSIQI